MRIFLRKYREAAAITVRLLTTWDADRFEADARAYRKRWGIGER
jgi:hypothetical protein